MISHLKGTVIYRDERSCVLSVNGVGYKVWSPQIIIEKLHDGDEVSFWTHLAVREDSQALYGFISKDELGFFELLISISGIGPKTALGILNVSSVKAIRRAVSTGDTSHLTKVSGIGKKIADKIVLELKGKFDAEDIDSFSMREEIDALEALKAIGFGHKESRDALKEVEPSITQTSERVKRALKILGK